MKRRIVLTRSTLSGVFDERRKCVVRLEPAYIETLDDPAADGAATGFERNVILELYDPGPHAVLLELPAPITTSLLTVEEQRHVDCVPLPMVTGGSTQLRIETQAGETLTLRGRGVAAIFHGRRSFEEE